MPKYREISTTMGFHFHFPILVILWLPKQLEQFQLLSRQYQTFVKLLKNRKITWIKRECDFMFYHFTMLQKLSKCEVKAWLCWNVIILPTLRFYMKSNFGEFKWSKNFFFGNFRSSKLWIFGKFGTWKLLKFTQIKIQSL